MFKKTLIILVLLFTFVSANILATGEPAITSVMNEEPDTQAEIQNIPSRIYVSSTRRTFSKHDYDAVPPESITLVLLKNGIQYRGSLTRYSYADVGTHWLAYYSGYVYIGI